MSKRFVFKKLVWWILTCTVCAVALWWVFPKAKDGREEKPVVLILWNIDTFEGGKGSRTAFLNKIAGLYEKENAGVTLLISSRTADGAKESLANGEIPDMLSFGTYFPFVTPIGEVSAWCRGGYALYSFTEDFSEADSSNTVVSSGGRNQPLVAAALNGFSGEYKIEESTTAYVNFLNGKYAYLLGTQRDVCRFASRGASVYCKPLEAFSDLYQSITVVSGENKEACEGFIGYLLSENSQKLLPSIGMLGIGVEVYSSDEPIQKSLERVNIAYTVSPYMDEDAARSMFEAAKEGLQGKNSEVLKNFLKAT